ncbi:MAG: AarF/UbiB family protein [Opitutaceae bacterium]|nr:AarF/UbiB family protein [Opitutaceae bacterium]
MKPFHSARRNLSLALLALRSVLHRVRPRSSSRDGLIRSMGKMGGFPQKIGQLLATTRLATSDRAFEALSDGAGHLDDGTFTDLANRYWPVSARPFSSVVRTLERESHGASLAQVKRAGLADGSSVAIKVKYPDIEYSIRTDLRAVGVMLKPLESRRQKDPASRYKALFAKELEKELDYARELEQIQWFRSRLGSDPTVSIPRPLPEFCSDRVLVTEWASGGPVRSTLDWPYPARCQAAQGLVRLAMRCLFSWGRLHGDLNPGNLRFHLNRDGSPTVSVLDFGAVYDLEEREKNAWINLVDLGRSASIDAESALEQFAAIGFDRDHLAPMKARLPDICRCLAHPFREGKAIDTREWRLARDLAQALGDDRMRFRQAAPARFVLFIRSIQGLLHHLDALRARANWTVALDEALGRDTQASLDDEASAVPVFADASPQLPDLHLSVHRDGIQTVAVTLPNASLDDLELLVPDSVFHSPDLIKRVAEEARANRAHARELLNHLEEGLQVRIWLGSEIVNALESRLH